MNPEILTITESITLNLSEPTIEVSVFDAVTLTENLQIVHALVVDLSDVVTLTESVQMESIMRPSVFDLVTVSENDLAPSVPSKPNVYDSIAVTEYSLILRIHQGGQMPLSRPQGSVKYGYEEGGSTMPATGLIIGGGL